MSKINLSDLQGYENLGNNEKRIVNLLIKGHSNKELGKLLSMGEKTLEKKLTEIYIKLGFVSERREKRISLFVRLLELAGF